VLRYDFAAPDTITGMRGRGGRLGVRERKKRQTRARLIDAAVNLVASRGYEGTTVEQIAAAVEVSPRTVAHYFPSKDLLLLSTVDTYIAAVGAELARVPKELPPLDALLAANLAALDNIERTGAPTTTRIATLLQTLYLSPRVQLLSMGMRPRRVIAELATRMGTDPADRRVELVVAVFLAVVVSAWDGLGRKYSLGELDASALPAILRHRLIATFADLVEISK
jgi:AcrR family transcriptional regulator